MAEETEKLAKRAYETYCAELMRQRTLKAVGAENAKHGRAPIGGYHPGRFPLATWEEQREEIRACWRKAVVSIVEPPRCHKPVTVMTPDGPLMSVCALAEGHTNPCGCFLIAEPDGSYSVSKRRPLEGEPLAGVLLGVTKCGGVKDGACHLPEGHSGACEAIK